MKYRDVVLFLYFSSMSFIKPETDIIWYCMHNFTLGDTGNFPHNLCEIRRGLPACLPAV